MKALRFLAAAVVALVVLLAPTVARADKVKDLCDVVGVRDNQLIGYGVVTGLAGTGDDVSAPFAAQSLLSLMRRLGVQIDQNVRLRNVAAVLVTATLPPFSRQGGRLDVTVSSIGNARSLQGGVLVQTLLMGADSKVYAVAQGGIALGGYAAAGAGASVQKNSANAARIPGGALVERQITTTYIDKGGFTLSLRQQDFATAQNVASAISQAMGAPIAHPVDSGAVEVKLGKGAEAKAVELLARIGEIEVPVAPPARIVINERTGTIVAGGDVRLSPVAIASGGITIVVKETPLVSQPQSFGRGQTQVVPHTDIQHESHGSNPTMSYIGGAASLADVAQALNSLGVTPLELATIIGALRSAGALRAQVVVQ